MSNGHDELRHVCVCVCVCVQVPDVVNEGEIYEMVIDQIELPFS